MYGPLKFSFHVGLPIVVDFLGKVPNSIRNLGKIFCFIRVAFKLVMNSQGDDDTIEDLKNHT